MFKSSTKRLCPSPWALGKHPNWSTLLVLNLPLWDLFFAPLKKESSLLQQSEAIHITTFVRMQFQSSSFEGFLNLRLSRTNGKLNLKLDGFVKKKTENSTCRTQLEKIVSRKKKLLPDWQHLHQPHPEMSRPPASPRSSIDQWPFPSSLEGQGLPCRKNRPICDPSVHLKSFGDSSAFNKSIHSSLTFFESHLGTETPERKLSYCSSSFPKFCKRFSSASELCPTTKGHQPLWVQGTQPAVMGFIEKNNFLKKRNS